ncbi:MAG TPA: phosphotransferase [Candidatus Saccharimonadales bacterium]|nr:phosphotransferase [Candidatus Saccharimonadales bacterium]
MSFRNDGQFPVSHISLASILSHYSINDFSYSLADGGIENTTCIIQAPEQTYALRIYRQAKKPLAAIKCELLYMSALRSQGLPVPTVYTNQHESAITQAHVNDQNWEALLMEYMLGQHPSGYTSALISQMAQAQAPMHLIGEAFDRPNNVVPHPTKLVESEFVHRVDQDKLDNKKLLDYIERIVKYEVILDKELPLGYSHFDFDSGNILVDSNGHLSAILDFDDLQYSPLVVCLGYTLWSILYETRSENLILRYMAEYQKNRRLCQLEQQFLPKVMLFRHYVITALKVLNGHTAQADVQKYEDVEKQIILLIEEQ